MSIRKYASTESADAFTEAVQDDKLVSKAPKQDTSAPDRLENKSVSWSDSENMEMGDALSRAGVEARAPDIKMAALKGAASRATGPHADIIKEAVGLSPLIRGGAQMGKKFLGKMLPKAQKAAPKAGPKSKMPTVGRTVGSLGTTGGFEGYHMNQVFRG